MVLQFGFATKPVLIVFYLLLMSHSATALSCFSLPNK